MKKIFFYILFLFTPSLLFSQIHEIGLFLGGSNYVGDIGKTNFISPNNFAGGLVYKYNYNPRIAFRASYTYLPIKADNREATNPFRNTKLRRFDNSIHEAAIGIEFNFFEYDLSDLKKSFTPYILVKFGAFNYRSPASIEQNIVKTESKMSYTIPLGFGIKGRLLDHLAYAIESRVQYTLVDDLDFTTDKFPENPILDFGGQGTDWYVFTGISLVYTFGRPPCYDR